MGDLSTPLPIPSSLLQPTPTTDPLDTLINLRKDMGNLTPFMNGQASDMAYGILGSYKSIQAASLRTISVMTLNVNGLTYHKLPLLCKTLTQDKVDILICVDTRHSADNIRHFKRKFKDLLGTGTTCFFTQDSLRLPGEPGGIGIVVGPQWGTSIDYDGCITDRSGHGVLARIRLRTSTGFLSIYGTYWPYVPASEDHSEGSAKLWSRVRNFCREEK